MTAYSAEGKDVKGDIQRSQVKLFFPSIAWDIKSWNSGIKCDSVVEEAGWCAVVSSRYTFRVDVVFKEGDVNILRCEGRKQFLK